MSWSTRAFEVARLRPKTGSTKANKAAVADVRVRTRQSVGVRWRETDAMWGNWNIDIWFYAMVTMFIASASLFFTTSRKARWLYMTFPAMLGCWYAYETAVSLSVPI